MRKLLALLCVALLTLVVAACGDGGGDADTTGEASVVATTVEAEPTPPEITDDIRSITVGGMGSQYAEPVRSVVDIGVRAVSKRIAPSAKRSRVGLVSRKYP